MCSITHPVVSILAIIKKKLLCLLLNLLCHKFRCERVRRGQLRRVSRMALFSPSQCLAVDIWVLALLIKLLPQHERY